MLRRHNGSALPFGPQSHGSCEQTLRLLFRRLINSGGGGIEKDPSLVEGDEDFLSAPVEAEINDDAIKPGPEMRSNRSVRT
jgi:hypothetical protein